jgi:hypothetical protein
MKLSLVLLVVILSPGVLFSQHDKSSPYIGYERQGASVESVLPNGVKYLGGGLIGDINAKRLVGISEMMQGNSRMVWLERSNRRTHGARTWKVLDVLRIDLRTSDEEFFPINPCTRNGREIPNLVAIGRHHKGDRYITLSSLWVADLERGSFREVSTRGVKCEYPEP